MSLFVKQQLWRTFSGHNGHARRVYLSTSFAQRCHRMERTDALQAALEAFVAESVKPSWKPVPAPNGIFTFVNDSMLVQDISHADVEARRRLSLKEVPWKIARPPSLIVRYVYRHRGQTEDYFANEWLQKIFGLWFEFMHAQLVMQEAG